MTAGSTRNTSNTRRNRKFADDFEPQEEDPKMQAVNTKLAQEKEEAFRELVMQQIRAAKINSATRCEFALLIGFPLSYLVA